MRGRLAALAMGLAVLIGTAWWLQPRPVPMATPTATAQSVATPSAISAADPAPTTDARTTVSRSPQPADWRDELLNTSLSGSEVDGTLSFARDGSLKPDEGLLRRFDFFLALSGERSEADIRRLLLASIAAQYGPVVAAEAEAWFDRYLGLRAELARQLQSGDLSQNLAAIEAAQQRWFGDQAPALFAAENHYRALAAERMRVLRDTELSAPAREAALSALETQLPPAVRDDLGQLARAELANEQTRQFEQMRASEAQRHAEREALFGAEAAQRLADLDAQRADWGRRLADYARQRDLILAQAGTDAAQQQAALTRLRNLMFSGPELVRVESLESIGQLPVGGG